jgi:hypothetical protein
MRRARSACRSAATALHAGIASMLELLLEGISLFGESANAGSSTPADIIRA